MQWLDSGTYPLLAPILQTLAIVACFTIQKRLLFNRIGFEEKEYSRSFLFPALLKSPRGALVTIGPMLLGVLFFHRLQWQVIAADGGYVWMIVTVLVVTCSWAYACMPYNYYYGKLHLYDRVLMVALALGAVWHPLFTAPFLATVLAFVSQLRFPLQLFSYTDKQPLFDLLNLSVCFLYVRVMAPSTSPIRYLFLSLCVMGAYYFAPGVKKLRIGWLGKEQLQRLLLAARDNGWLHWLGLEKIRAAVAFIGRTNTILLWLVMAVELGAILMLLNVKLAVILLVGSLIVHVGIFAASGILFWKWIIVNLTLVASLLSLSQAGLQEVFAIQSFLLSLVLFGLNSFWLSPNKLGWLDTSLSPAFRFQCQLEDGIVCELIPAQMTPYDFPMAQGRLYPLAQTPILTRTYGTTSDAHTMRAVEDAQSVDEMRATIDRWGRVEAGEAGGHTYTVRFLQRYFGNLNHHLAKGRGLGAGLLAKCHAPLHIYTGHVLSMPPFDGSRQIRRIQVSFVYSWLRGTETVPVVDKLVLDVAIPLSSG